MSQLTRLLLMHHKEERWADYLRTYSNLSHLEKQGLVTVEVKSLPQQNAHKSFAQLPERIRRLLFFAKPDLVVALDDGRKPVQPIFAIDVTEHVAARDHWIQRFPNMVGCAQENVPGAFIAPRDMPNRKGFQGRTDPFFFFAYDRVIEIHQTPIYIAEWPSSDGANLDSDPKFLDLPPSDAGDMARTLAFFNHVLDAAIKGADLSTLMRERMIVDLRNNLRRIGYQQIPTIAHFDRLTVNMPDARPLTGKEFRKWVQLRGLVLPADLPDRILKRDSNLVFAPHARAGNPAEQRQKLRERIKQKSGDPYTQMPLVFDYLFCRLGPTTVERDTNLVVDLGILRFSDFAEYVVETWKHSPLGKSSYADIAGEIPIYTLHLREGINQVLKTFVRLYAFSADIIVFQDGILYF